MPSRRAVLGTLGAVSVAGCASLSDNGGPGISVGGGDPCTAVETDWVDPPREGVEPRPLPEGPPGDPKSAVQEFVVAYEAVYLYNSLLALDTLEAGVGIRNPDVASVERGFVVEMTTGYHVKAMSSDDDGTTDVYWVRGPSVRTSYLVTDRRLVRAPGNAKKGVTDPDPRRGGTIVECWRPAV